MNKEIITAHMPVRNMPASVTILYEQGKPAECYVESDTQHSDLGWIYIGRVESIESGLSAAFVRVSEDRRVYMPIDRKHTDLKQGDEIPVQIRQEAQKTKLPKGSPDWEIAGNYLVLSAEITGIAYSRKLTTEQKAVLKPLAVEWKQGSCGVLFRTKASGASADQLREEYAELLNTVCDVRKRAASRTCYTVLYRTPGLQHRLISRCAPGELSRFLTDDVDLAVSMKDICASAGSVSVLYKDPQIALYRLFSLTTVLDRLLAVRVPLRSGGSLVIEQTEAFVVIDVNTGKYTGKHTLSETAHRINCEAAEEAAKQIRLRQLSGTILIDFVNSSFPEEEKLIGEILRKSFLNDPVYTKLVDFTALHICEITRKKAMRSLQEQIRALKDGTDCERTDIV